MEKLKLGHTNPLAFIKIQTTGMDFKKDRIVELSITRVETDGSSRTGTRLVNPEMPIPSESTKINNITDDMVKDKKTFKDIAVDMCRFLDGCDFVGFSIENFDLRFLGEEFNRAGVEFSIMGRKVIDISKIYHTMEPRDLSAAYSFYCDKTMLEKSGSENITNTYFEIINNMFEKYKGKEYVDKDEKKHIIEPSIDSINKIFNKNITRFDVAGNIIANESGRPIFNFGKNKGVLISEFMIGNKDYYEWFMEVSEFPIDTKAIVKRIVEKARAASLVK